jgi:hypothetical protein
MPTSSMLSMLGKHHALKVHEAAAVSTWCKDCRVCALGAGKWIPVVTSSRAAYRNCPTDRC